MQMRSKLEPRVVPKFKQRTALVFAGAGLVIATIVGIISFFSLNLGSTEDALAASFSTNQNGNWNTGSTWVGNNVPGNWGNHNITLNHNITNVLSGNIRGMTAITLTAGKTLTTSVNLTLEAIASFLSNGGDITINGDLTLNNSTVMTINSGNLTVTGNLIVQNSSSLIFNSSGTLNISGNLNSSGGSGKNININSGTLNVGGSVLINSGTTLNIANGVQMNASYLSTSNNSDAIVNLNGTGNITGNVDLRGPFNVGTTGDLTIGGDVSIENGSGTLNVAGDADILGTVNVDRSNGLVVESTGHVTVGEDLLIQGGNHSAIIDGLIEVANDIFVTGGSANLAGTGILAWEGDVTISGGSANINGFTTIPGSPVDLGSMTTTVLPVELLSFTASTNDNTVILSWQTASELNNDYFTIERSSNGIDFKSIAEITGMGNTKDISSYKYSDNKPLQGLSYYRLKQTDFDGTTETFRPVSVNLELQVENKMDIYPNPLLGRALKLRMENPEEGEVEIFNQSGKKVYAKNLKGFSNEEEINLPENLRSGIYLVNVKTISENKSFRLVKN